MKERWDAYAGTRLYPAGTKRNGKPHNVLAIVTISVFTATDMRAMKKKYQLKFVEKT